MTRANTYPEPESSQQQWRNTATQHCKLRSSRFAKITEHYFTKTAKVLRFQIKQTNNVRGSQGSKVNRLPRDPENIKPWNLGTSIDWQITNWPPMKGITSNTNIVCLPITCKHARLPCLNPRSNKLTNTTKQTNVKVNKTQKNGVQDRSIKCS